MNFSKALLEDLYRTMLKIRLCEESLVEPILDGTIKCPVHLYTGQEAVAAGLCANLTIEDYIFGNHRSHGHYLAKGGDMNEMVAEIYCKETGCAKGRGGSMHLISPENGVMGIVPIVAGTISLATGAAWAASVRNDKRVTVSFFGDGATGEGVLYESMNFASLNKLPIIFACENNLYSTHMAIEKIRPQKYISEVAIPFHMKTYRVNGNDVLKVYEKCKEAIEYTRQGNGPVFMEFLTYRLRGHVGPDDNIQGTHTDIRPEKEIAKWKKTDPIPKFEKYLVKNNLVSKNKLDEIKLELQNEVKNAHDFARNSNWPQASEINKYVFKEKAELRFVN